MSLTALTLFSYKLSLLGIAIRFWSSSLPRLLLSSMPLLISGPNAVDLTDLPEELTNKRDVTSCQCRQSRLV
jgi:hypothetical protein